MILLINLLNNIEYKFKKNKIHSFFHVKPICFYSLFSFFYFKYSFNMFMNKGKRLPIANTNITENRCQKNEKGI
jgi:hypothetical protein